MDEFVVAGFAYMVACVEPGDFFFSLYKEDLSPMFFIAIPCDLMRDVYAIYIVCLQPIFFSV